MRQECSLAEGCPDHCSRELTSGPFPGPCPPCLIPFSTGVSWHRRRPGAPFPGLGLCPLGCLSPAPAAPEACHILCPCWLRRLGPAELPESATVWPSVGPHQTPFSGKAQYIRPPQHRPDRHTSGIQSLPRTAPDWPCPPQCHQSCQPRVETPFMLAPDPEETVVRPGGCAATSWASNCMSLCQCPGQLQGFCVPEDQGLAGPWQSHL